jgi:putative MFS transporter
MGRLEEARATLARFGITVGAKAKAVTAKNREVGPLKVRDLLGVTAALTLAAMAWGFVNFGILLWLPGRLVAEGRSMGGASALIARSTLIAVPAILVSTWLYTVWSTKRTLMAAIGVTTLGLIAILLRDQKGLPLFSNPVLALALLIVGSSAVISILLPYAAESFPLRVRARATGWVAGFSKAGGLTAQGLGALALVPALGVAAGLVAIPSVLSMVLIAVLGRDTRGRDLRELETGRPVPAEGAAD